VDVYYTFLPRRRMGLVMEEIKKGREERKKSSEKWIYVPIFRSDGCV
jgi:hypothetical protein